MAHEAEHGPNEQLRAQLEEAITLKDEADAENMTPEQRLDKLYKPGVMIPDAEVYKILKPESTEKKTYKCGKYVLTRAKYIGKYYLELAKGEKAPERPPGNR